MLQLEVPWRNIHQQKIIKLWELWRALEYSGALQSSQSLIIFCWCTGYVQSVACSPESWYIISGCYQGIIQIWDAETGTTVGKPLKAHENPVRSVTYSCDGWHITSGSNDGIIQTWDSDTGVAVGSPLKGHTRSVLSVAYSPDGWHIISGSADHSIQIWYSKTSHWRQHTHKQHGMVPCGRVIQGSTQHGINWAVHGI